MLNNNPVQRRIGLATAVSVVVANMIGTGIFTTTGVIAKYLPDNIWILFCWLLGGAIAMSGALCYSELATRMPEEGGEYVYLKRLYHPVVGFLSGWTSFFIGFSAPVAGAALSFAAYFYAGLDISVFGNLISADSEQKVLAILVIVLFTAVHYVGIRFGSVLQIGLTVLKVLIVAGLSAAGIYFGSGELELNFSASVSSIDMGGPGIAMMLVMFSYSGWNASTYIAGEIKNPGKNLPRSLIMGTLIVTALYLLLNVFVLKELSVDQIKDTIAVVKEVSAGVFGVWLGKVFGLLVSIALLSSLSAFIIIGPRVYYAMARDGMFMKFAAKMNSKYNVPGYSIVIQSITASVMILIGSFEQLVIYIGFALNLFPWLTVLGVFIARARGIGETQVSKMPGYPVLPIFYLVSSLILTVIAFVNRPAESITAIITVMAGIPVYYLWVRTKIKPA